MPSTLTLAGTVAQWREGWPPAYCGGVEHSFEIMFGSLWCAVCGAEVSFADWTALMQALRYAHQMLRLPSDSISQRRGTGMDW